MPSIRTVANNLARMKKDHKKERAFEGSKPSISTFYNQCSDLHKSSVEIELHGIVGTEEKREGGVRFPEIRISSVWTRRR